MAKDTRSKVATETHIAAHNGDMDAATLGLEALAKSKPGVQTTEFYLSIAVMVCALVLTLANKISGDVGLGAITAAGVGYAVSRGLAKT